MGPKVNFGTTQAPPEFVNPSDDGNLYLLFMSLDGEEVEAVGKVEENRPSWFHERHTSDIIRRRCAKMVKKSEYDTQVAFGAEVRQPSYRTARVWLANQYSRINNWWMTATMFVLIVMIITGLIYAHWIYQTLFAVVVIPYLIMVALYEGNRVGFRDFVSMRGAKTKGMP